RRRGVRRGSRAGLAEAAHRRPACLTRIIGNLTHEEHMMSERAAPSAKRPDPIPADYRGATPYICVHDGKGALDWYQRAFGAKVTMRMDQPDGRIGHAEFRIGDAVVMLADEFPEI